MNYNLKTILIFFKNGFIIFLLILTLLVYIFVVNNIIRNSIETNNTAKLSKFSFQEGEVSIIHDKTERWKATFDGGSQLLTVKINELEIRNYNKLTDTKISTCYVTAREKDYDYIPKKVYYINYTDIWYFGFPLETKIIQCKV